VLEKSLKDRRSSPRCEVRQGFEEGWDYAKSHPDEAGEIILAGDSTGAKTEKDQKRMRPKVGKLSARPTQARRQDYEANGCEHDVGRIGPRHHQEAEGAYSFAVYDAMK